MVCGHAKCRGMIHILLKLEMNGCVYHSLCPATFRLSVDLSLCPATFRLSVVFIVVLFMCLYVISLVL